MGCNSTPAERSDSMGVSYPETPREAAPRPHARDLDSHLRLLAGSGAVDPAGTAEVLDLLDRVRALTWRLVEKTP